MIKALTERPRKMVSKHVLPFDTWHGGRNIATFCFYVYTFLTNIRTVSKATVGKLLMHVCVHACKHVHVCICMQSGCILMSLRKLSHQLMTGLTHRVVSCTKMYS